jgi:hypothetical protein
MSLFKSVEKWKKESEESVRVKAELTKHDAAFRAVMAAFEAGVPEVERLVSEIAIREAGGSLQGLQGLKDELVKAKQNRDRPFQNYKSIQGDFRCKLEALVRPFIHEEMERLENETLKIKDEKVHQEIPREKEEPGVFSMGGPHKISSNRKAISSFRAKSLENLNHLRDMVHSSIPEIEEFIEKTEAEMRAIDLTPVEIVMDEKEFEHDRIDSGKEPGKTETGYIPPLGKPFIVNPQAGQGKDSGDDLFRRFDSFKAKL